MLTGPTRHVAIATLATILGGIVWLWGHSAGRHESRRLAEVRREHVLPANDRLEPAVRMVLHGRMRRHAATAERLWDAFIAADHSAIAAYARELADEPQLAKPADGEDPALLNTAIPKEFFAYQDELARNAAALASAAEQHDDANVVTRFQRTAGSCFACHSHYRSGAPNVAAP